MSTRRIGLSLGADICWPACYEAIVKRLDLDLEFELERVRFQVERVPIEPFHIRQPSGYDLVIDRLTHWYPLRREWIKRALLGDGLYVLNNPWTVQAMEKHTSYAAMAHLGLRVPETWMLPPKAYAPTPYLPWGDVQPTLERYARLFDLGAVGQAVGYPAFMKPYDGGGWVNVSRIADEQALREAYDRSGTSVMLLQRAVEPREIFVRCIGVGPQVRFVDYDPDAPLHDRYRLHQGFLAPAEEAELVATTLAINDFFGWDYNSCEAIRSAGVWHPFDFSNIVPDTQVTSLHAHFPWVVKALLRWTLYCAATRRPMRRLPRWEPYLAAREAHATYAARLAAYGALALEHFDADRFEAFCERHLPHLDEVAWEFFGSDEAKDIVRQKVSALYPVDETEPFTELFWSRIQGARNQEATRRASSRPPPG